jgi:hypothetical protein
MNNSRGRASLFRALRAQFSGRDDNPINPRDRRAH